MILWTRATVLLPLTNNLAPCGSGECVHAGDHRLLRLADIVAQLPSLSKNASQRIGCCSSELLEVVPGAEYRPLCG